MRPAARKCEANSGARRVSVETRIQVVDSIRLLLCYEAQNRGLLHLFNGLLH